MQKSGPGTEAQSESISSRDRNLIQVILRFIPRLADLKVFSTSDTHRHHLVMFAPGLGSRKSWCGIFCPLGMDSEFTIESPCIWSRTVGFISQHCPLIPPTMEGELSLFLPFQHSYVTHR